MSEMQMVIQQLQTLQRQFDTLEKDNALLQMEFTEVHRGLEQTNEIVHRLHVAYFANDTPTPPQEAIMHAKMSMAKVDHVICDLVYNQTSTVITLSDTECYAAPTNVLDENGANPLRFCV